MAKQPGEAKRDEKPVDRMIELGHQLQALSEMVLNTAKQMKAEEELPRDPG